ncbi:MAG: LysM peptidoglycan-binding domain-containing protein, partial [Anaerolineae bacterium]|nr:LysM peptidoglycan-binding domain-containing protein [Anaerolineae bacterium]
MPHALPTLRTNVETYVVQRGDSLGSIAQRYGVDLNTLVNANQITNPDLLEVGTTLIIPAPLPLPPGPDFKIIPDSELVLGPNTISFDVGGFLDQTNGYLASYHGEIEEGVTYSGAEIVQRISREFSVNPRILLAVIEYQTGWVTRPQPDDYTLDFPAGYTHPAYKGLYRQLAWTANNLNRGYYLWKAGGISGWLLADGSVIPPAPTINAGTAGVQHLFSLLFNQSAWQKAVTQNGLSAAYQSLFGIPFDYAVEPLIPENLTQPTFQLPFESGQVWSFTGGPHGGWGSGSAWAALDFAPPGDALGCVSSDAWVTAIADGLIVH